MKNLWTCSLLLILVSTGAVFGAAECALVEESSILLSEGDASLPGSRLLRQWDVENSAVFLSDRLPPSPSLQKFREGVRQKLPHYDQDFLLRKSLAGDNLSVPDAANVKAVLSQQAKWIRPMRCLEGLLLSVQTDRLDMLTRPSEFIAFALRSADRRKLRLYFYTTNEPGIRKLGTVTSLVENDVKSGNWKLWLNIHNHNFFFDAKIPLRGGVAPSATDVTFYNELSKSSPLEEVWITNGFDGLRVTRSELPQLFPNDLKAR